MTRKWIVALVLAASVALVSCSRPGDSKPDGHGLPSSKPDRMSMLAAAQAGSPTIINPAEEMVEFAPDGILRWTEAPGADVYEVWAYADPGLTQLVEFSKALVSRQYQFTNLQGGRTYHVKLYYRVLGGWSDLPVFTLTTTTQVLKARLSNPQEELDGFGSSATLRWSPVPGAEKYEVWVYRDAGLVAYAEASGPLLITQYQVTTLKPGSVYYVQLYSLVGGEYHAGGALKLTMATNVRRARILNPQEELDAFATNGILRWSPVTGASKYEVWVFTNPNSSIIYENSGPLATRTYQMRTLQPGSVYYAQVFSLVDDVWQVGSPVRITTIGQPTVARLTTPQEELENFATNGTLRWTEVPGATAYELWIFGNAGLGVVAESGPGSERSYQVRQLCTPAVYYVQTHAFLNGKWTAGWATRLDVKQGANPANCVPPAPRVSLAASPSDIVIGQSTTLTWTTEYASSCTADGAWTGARPTSGQEVVGPLTANSLFVLNCAGPSGTSRGEVLVGVGPSALAGISVADQSQPEGNSGTSPMTFTVTLDRPAPETVSFDYRTEPGSATAGEDYLHTTGLTQIPAGLSSTTIAVPIIGDMLAEPNETFTLRIGATSPNAQIVRGTATGTILDDGDVPGPSTTAGIWYGEVVDGLSGESIPLRGLVTEAGATRLMIGIGGLAGGQIFGTMPTTGTSIRTDLTGVFYPENYWSNGTQLSTVTLDGTFTPQASWSGSFTEGPGYGTFSFDYQTAIYERPSSLDLIAGTYAGTMVHDTSSDPVGYTVTLVMAANGSLTGSDTRGCQYAGTVSVPMPTRNYYSVSVTATNCPQQSGTYVGTMFFDGAGGGLRDLYYLANNGNSIWTGMVSRRVAGAAGITIADSAKPEGNAGTSLQEFVVTLNRAMATDVTVSYGTLTEGSATAGEDFVATQGTLVIPAGATSGVISVPIFGDTVGEGPEKFYVALIEPSANAYLLDGLAVGTILEDDVLGTFNALGKLSSSFSGTSSATGVSNDGTVAGLSPNESGMFEAFRWQGGVMTGLGVSSSQALAISGDGTVIVGGGRYSSAGDEALRWQGGTVTGLGDLPGGVFYSIAYGVSANGSVVVGLSSSGSASVAGYEAFRWQGGVMTALGDLAGGFFDSKASAASADGSVVVGRGLSASGQEAFRWQGGVMTGLGDLAGGTFESEASGVSADGSVVVGYGTSASGKEAFRWQGGVMSGLGDLDGGQYSSQALAVAANGTVVVGIAYDATGQRAMIWTPASGMRSLQQALLDAGAPVPLGWRLTVATSISPDGHWIAGYGYNPSGFREAWRASLY